MLPPSSPENVRTGPTVHRMLCGFIFRRRRKVNVGGTGNRGDSKMSTRAILANGANQNIRDGEGPKVLTRTKAADNAGLSERQHKTASASQAIVVSPDNCGLPTFAAMPPRTFYRECNATLRPLANPSIAVDSL